MISTHHLNLAIGTDFFFANGSIFLHAKSQKINLLTSQFCASRSLRTIITALEKVMRKHNCRGLKITDMRADNEFDKAELKNILQPMLLHIYGQDEHFGFIDMSMLTINERFRSTCIAMPFRSITMLMVRSLVEVTTDVLNAFPYKNGVAETISPATIIECKQKMDL